MLNFLFFIKSGESIPHVALSFRSWIALAGYPIRLMKFPAGDFNFQSLAGPIDVSVYMYIVEEVKLLTSLLTFQR